MVSIPDKAKKVFEGEIFDVYQWKQKMFDGSVETFEMLKRPDTVQVIAEHKGKLVLAEQQQPNRGKFYSFLGGRVDQEADHLKAAKRELLEESGLVSEDWGFYKKYTPISKIDWSIYFYFARDCIKKAEQNLDPGEKIDLKYVDFDEFLKITSEDVFTAGEFTNEILRLRLDQKKLDEFKNKIFKNE